MGLEALEGMVNTVRAAPTNMSNAEMQMVHDGLKRHFRAMDLLDIGRVLKHHLCTHLIHNIPLHGNPRTYALFFDEAFNGKAEEDRCGLPPDGLLQARPCRLPHCARPESEGRGVLDRQKRRRAHGFFGTDFCRILTNTQNTSSHTHTCTP